MGEIAKNASPPPSVGGRGRGFCLPGSEEEEMLPPDPPLVWVPDYAEEKPQEKAGGHAEVSSAIDELLNANEAQKLPSLDPEPMEPDLGESDGVEDGPDTHEAIDMVMAANDMEVHVVDYAKAKRERELGEARKAEAAKKAVIHHDKLPPMENIKSDIGSEIDALMVANLGGDSA